MEISTAKPRSDRNVIIIVAGADLRLLGCRYESYFTLAAKSGTGESLALFWNQK
jgi:hypothetical protein